MPWQIYALISIILYTVFNLMQRKLAVESQFPRSASILFTAIAGIFSLGYAAVTGAFAHLQLPTAADVWMIVLLACVCYGLLERGRFVAAKYLEASVFNTLINSSLLITSLGGLFIFGEQLTNTNLLGILLILAGLCIVSYEGKVKTLEAKHVALGLGLGGVLGLAWVADKQAISSFEPNIYNVLVWTLPIFVVLFPRVKVAEIKTEWKLGSWRLVTLAVCNVLGYLAQIRAVALADVALVMPVVQVSVITTVVISILFLKERTRITQKIIAAVLATVGTFFLI